MDKKEVKAAVKIFCHSLAESDHFCLSKMNKPE